MLHLFNYIRVLEIKILRASVNDSAFSFLPHVLKVVSGLLVELFDLRLFDGAGDSVHLAVVCPILTSVVVLLPISGSEDLALRPGTHLIKFVCFRVG